MKEEIGGYTDFMHPNQDYSVAVIFNDEGKQQGREANRIINGNMYAGKLILAGMDESGNLCSLTPIQRETYKQVLSLPKEKHNENRLKKEDVMK